jgi:hypothetical protein
LLIEITRDIPGTKDETGKYVLDLILDTAGQKGTGKWTVISAASLGVPIDPGGRGRLRAPCPPSRTSAWPPRRY